MEPFRRIAHPRTVAAVLFFAAFGGLALRGAPRLEGDGLEYMMQTQAIALDGELRIDLQERSIYWNRTNPFGHGLQPLPADQTPPPRLWDFGGAFRDRAGNYRYYHFWAYPLSVAPLYALLHRLDPAGRLEYHAFRITNAVYLLLPFVVAWAHRPSWPLLVAFVLLLTSPLLTYVDWPHPELFCFSLVVLSFLLIGRPVAHRFAPVLLGFAASQNVPILAFLPLHFALSLSRQRPRGARAVAGIALAYGVGVLVALLAPLYVYHHFRTWNLIVAIGMADPAAASAGKVASFFLSPLAGAVWFFPALFLLVPAYAGRREGVTLGGAVVSIACAVWLASAAKNFNAGQVGALRYAVWALGPLFFTLFAARWLLESWSRLLSFAAGVAGTLLVVAQLGLHKLVAKSHLDFYTTNRARPEVAAILRVFPFPDDVEILAENISGRELTLPREFRGVYLWNLGEGRSLWLFSGRALGRMKELRWRAPGLPRYRASPPAELFSWSDGEVLFHPERVERLHRHPVWDTYLRVWMEGEVRELRSDVPVYVR